MLCADGPVRTLAGLSLAPEHRCGHGALYDAVNHGRISIGRLRRVVAGLPLPRAAGGRLVLAVDVSNWLRPGAATSPDRLSCHVYGRGKGQAQMIPGWPYSVIAALEPGRTSWTAVLDAVRPGPDDDEAEVTAAQVREVVGRLIEAGHWREGDPGILVIFDAGYDVMRLACRLADLPVEVLGRLRSDRVLHFPEPGRRPGTQGRPRRHGGEFALADPATWPQPPAATTTATTRYGTATAQARDRLHPRLTHRSIRDPAAAGRRAWLIIAAHAQLRLARPLAADLRRPRERPAPRAGSPRPGSAAGSGTSARRQPSRPVHRNPASRAPAAHPGRRTAGPQPATTWEKRPGEKSPSRQDPNAQVKQQAQSLSGN